MSTVKINTAICCVGFIGLFLIYMFGEGALYTEMTVLLVGYMVQVAILEAVKELKR